ncbi:hypothetical protein CVT24_012961 [Panaeolus cyanescens]|uniref:Uncharacterized protein n=1 Tax=Panaeolus cyanescens TaxID=181874 RepID=A0A409WL24_9AGAR|nr:hypothetical protein CVT24_012961 [Panaeolus cyanescens]
MLLPILVALDFILCPAIATVSVTVKFGRDRLRDRRGGRDRDEESTDRGSEASSHRGDLRLGRAATPRPGHHRDHSVESSYSSASSVNQNQNSRGQEVLARSRSNSSAVAQALGLSQTPPSEYGRLGGPGVMGGRPRRDERSGSMSSNGSAKRSGMIGNRDDAPSSSDRRDRERERDREWDKMEKERERRLEYERTREPALSKSGSQR